MSKPIENYRIFGCWHCLPVYLLTSNTIGVPEIIGKAAIRDRRIQYYECDISHHQYHLIYHDPCTKKDSLNCELYKKWQESNTIKEQKREKGRQKRKAAKSRQEQPAI